MAEQAGAKGMSEVAEGPFDAREYLKRTLPRQVGDVLKITQIPGTHSFRANWYDSRAGKVGGVPGLTITYIRKSAFLYCRVGADGKPEIRYPGKQ